MALDPKVFVIAEENASHPKVTHAKLIRVIMEGDNADVEYQEGYVVGEEFNVLGVNKVHVADAEEEEVDSEGNVITPTCTDFTDFKTLMNNSNDVEVETITYLMGKLQ
jgi:hypothetical protein